MIKILCKKLIPALVMAVICLLPVGNAEAMLVERIVAVVNDNVILLSELKAAMLRVEEGGKKAEAKDVLEGMIHKRLLLEQAKKFSFGRDTGDAIHHTQEQIIQHYIDKRIKALIHVPFKDIEEYYFNNLDRYAKRDLYDIKDEIEEYLLNMTLEVKVLEHIDELIEASSIRIQLD